MRPFDVLDFIWPWARLGSLYRELQQAHLEARTTEGKLRTALALAQEAEDKLVLLRKKAAL